MFEELSDFANLPLLAITATLLSLLLMPALNAYSRYNERQADRYAFESIASVEPFISSMNKLAQQNLAERTPAKWIELLFHSHPAISRRVAAAEEWGARKVRGHRRNLQIVLPSKRSKRKCGVNGGAEFRPRVADLLPCPRPRNRTAFRPRRLRFRFPGSAVVPAVHFSPSVDSGWLTKKSSAGLRYAYRPRCLK